MDNHASDILCGMYSPLVLGDSLFDSTMIQVALFLLCMPIIAAPLQAIAVLGKWIVISSGVDLSRAYTRLRSYRHTRVLCYT